jgi:hypothetical protein
MKSTCANPYAKEGEKINGKEQISFWEVGCCGRGGCIGVFHGEIEAPLVTS